MNNSVVFGFSRPKTMMPPPLFSWAIMGFESLTALKWVNFSHAYVRFYSSEWDRDIVYQASGTKVNLIEWSRFQSIEVIVREFEVPVSDDAFMMVAQFCIDSLGSGYALAGAFGIILVKLAALFGMKIQNPITQGGYWCSEAAAIVAEDADLSIDPDEVRSMTPLDLCDFLSERATPE